MGTFRNYYGYVENEASYVYSDYREELIDNIMEGNTDVYEYFDEPIFQWVDREFGSIDLIDIAEILEKSDNVESDWGLWEGIKEPRKALETQAFFTYRGDLTIAVMELAKDYLRELEEESQEKVSKLEEELKELNDRLEVLEDEDEEGELYSECESDIMLTEEKIDEENDRLSNIQEALSNI